MKIINGDTSKMREVLEDDKYDPDSRKSVWEGCVMAPHTFPLLTIPEQHALDDENLVVVEIYQILCTTTNKSYVGQTVSHVLNHKRYRRYGSDARFRSHVSEAIKNNKTKQCHYLNNAIRKYGRDSFITRVVAVCHKDESDHWENEAITHFGTLAPNGYNLKSGGQFFQHTIQSKTRVSSGVTKYYEDARLKRFEGVYIPSHINVETLVRKLVRNGEHFGWYLLFRVDGVKYKTDFAGVCIDTDVSKERAIQFAKLLQKKERT